MDQQRFHRVAGRVALRLRVVGDADRHVRIGKCVDVDVANAVEVLDHRNFRFSGNPLDQAFAAAWHDHVDVLLVGDETPDGIAVGGRDDLDRRFRQACRDESFMDARGDGLIARERFAAAAKNRRVAGLEAQRRGVRRDIRPRLVHDADHAQRHAHMPDLNAGRPKAQVGDFADRIRQRCDLLQPRSHRFDARRRQCQAVDKRGVFPCGPGGANVVRIRRHQRRGIAADRCRHRA